MSKHPDLSGSDMITQYMNICIAQLHAQINCTKMLDGREEDVSERRRECLAVISAALAEWNIAQVEHQDSVISSMYSYFRALG